jgi:hypothetical protein
VFAYEKHEWDNIPSIVPRYVIYLSKYIAGISAICKEVTDRESTYDLRMEMEYKDETTNNLLKDQRVTDLNEKKGINDDINKLDKKCDDFRNNYDKFTNEATKLSDLDCNETFSQCMDIVLATKGSNEVPSKELIKPEHTGIM